MNADWITALAICQRDGRASVLVTVTEVAGSTPRAAGTKMLVTTDALYGTIGGGALEFTAIETARALLDDHVTELRTQSYPLGPALGQCCGGHVSLLFEPICPPALRVGLFGAGHVAKALVAILGTLPARVTWVDNRPELFPATLPNNVTAQTLEDPTLAVGDGYSHILIMTHDHALDYRLVKTALSLSTSSFVGVIGSKTKRARFASRLRGDGLDPARLICPIGLPGLNGKHPGEIAVAVAAQLLSPPNAVTTPKPAPAGDANGCTGCATSCGMQDYDDM
ncbi:xanthine dehydrogenase accessory protein XdhC [Niveispirillum lacus]|uniref:Xanthine dehydrogenase accessory protein XdhC n=1 Tax=Niveispirillum lacus TaxID=1981099 RepID=A0A255YQL9_9PROT|nr:xanthine dehydrogenase accessory protein XdhC [Niveispirillum lacus]OYQ31523.1 xanthine dehydrogenase accessory protein XdhC [Niveispirillum lacus]